MKHSLLILLLCSGILSGCTSVLTALVTPKVETELVELKAGQYALDKSHASLLFKVGHLGLSTYVGRFNDFDASLQFDPNNIADAKLTAVISIDSLDINDPDLKSDLMGRGWFNQAQYPQAQFNSVSVKPLSETEFEFTGDLVWRGVTKPISVNATFHGGADNILTGKYTLGFSAKASFSRSEFGMDKYVPLVGDEISIETYAEFLRN